MLVNVWVIMRLSVKQGTGNRETNTHIYIYITYLQILNSKADFGPACLHFLLSSGNAIN